MGAEVVVAGWSGMDRFLRQHELVRSLPGGKAWNQAVACSVLGTSVAIVGCIGDDDGNVLKLRNIGTSATLGNRLSTQWLRQIPRTKTAEVFLTLDGTLISVSPHVAEQLTANDISRAIEREKPRIVLVTAELGAQVLQATRQAAHRYNATLYVNAAPAGAVARENIPTCDRLLVNESEAIALATDPNLQGEALLDDLASLGKNVVITLGPKGCIYQSTTGDAGSVRSLIRDEPAPHSTSIGMGDCFAAALAHCSLEGMRLPQAVQAATRFAFVAARSAEAVPCPGFRQLGEATFRGVTPTHSPLELD